jgi:molecular chaperone DnaK (HSP70)
LGEKHRVVAAIDFGTHGTGFAWATVNSENAKITTRRISFFESWEGQQISYPKNRSALLLDTEGLFLSWGHQAVAQMDAMPKGAGWQLHTGFKMSLQRNLGGSAAVGDGSGLVLSDGADAGDAFRLTVLCLEQVFAKARAQITRGPYLESEIRWCLTVPAIWDQYTRDMMFKAAVEAGLPNDPERLLLAREPAVAALYCVAKGETVLSTPGTRFMVVDAGGGTVDITTYQVAADGRLNELTPASGAKTGSEYLNKAFMNEVLVERFGGGAVTRILSEQRGALAGTMNAWERAKRSFAPESRDDLVIPLSAPFYAALLREQASGRWGGRGEPDTEIVVSRDLVASLFDQQVDATVRCVEQQLRDMQVASGQAGGEIVLLVGGFAESPYLRGQLGAKLAGRGVRLLIPEQPAVAVLAGAVHFAYDPSVFMAWRAPFTVGIGVNLPFRPGRDPEHLRLTDDRGRDLCKGRLDVFVSNREAVSSDKKVSRIYTPIQKNQTSITLNMFSTSRADVEYITDPGVDPLGSLTVDLSSSMNLPMEERAIEVIMYLGENLIRVTGRNVHTHQPEEAHIKWQPTW